MAPDTIVAILKKRRKLAYWDWQLAEALAVLESWERACGKRDEETRTALIAEHARLVGDEEVVVNGPPATNVNEEELIERMKKAMAATPDGPLECDDDCSTDGYPHLADDEPIIVEPPNVDER